MLTPEQRKFIIDTIAVRASDTVLLNALDESTRELAHATVLMANVKNATAVKKEIAKPVQQELPIDVPFTPLAVSPMPIKLGATGQACIAALKRSTAGLTLSGITSCVGLSMNQVKPQVALAIQRKLIRQVEQDRFVAV